MNHLPLQILNFEGPEIKGTPEFFVSLYHGMEYQASNRAWKISQTRGFIEYTLIMEERASILGMAEIALPTSEKKGEAQLSIVINGLVYAPEFAVTQPTFSKFHWEVPGDFLWPGENTIVTPLLPDSSSGILVKKVTVQGIL